MSTIVSYFLQKNSDKRLLLDAEIYFNGTKQSYNHTQLTNKRIID